MRVKVIPELFTNDIPDDLANNEAQNTNQQIHRFGKITPHQSLFPLHSLHTPAPPPLISTPDSPPQEGLLGGALGPKKTMGKLPHAGQVLL